MSSSERCGSGSGERERPKPLKGFYTERRDKEEIESFMASKAFGLSSSQRCGTGSERGIRSL